MDVNTQCAFAEKRKKGKKGRKEKERKKGREDERKNVR